MHTQVLSVSEIIVLIIQGFKEDVSLVTVPKVIHHGMEKKQDLLYGISSNLLLFHATVYYLRDPYSSNLLLLANPAVAEPPCLWNFKIGYEVDHDTRNWFVEQIADRVWLYIGHADCDMCQASHC